MDRDSQGASEAAAEELARSGRPGTLDMNQATRIEEAFLRDQFARPTSWSKLRWMLPHQAKYEHLWRYRLVSPVRTIVCGTLGILLLAGQFGYATWAAEHASVVVSDYAGLVRLGMLFAGALLVFFAWPEYRHIEHCDDEQDKLDALKSTISHRRWRGD